jgi:AcrR family transcriptional regulator
MNSSTIRIVDSKSDRISFVNTTDDLRERMLAAAEEQLIASPDGEIATRAVCEAVGVTQPVLYRIFGDKRGLLDALAEAGLARYTSRKAKLEVTDDPVVDLRAGWDDHMRFAADNPALYRLMFMPRPWTTDLLRDGVMRLLVETLTRCAARGALAADPEAAAKLILSANVGLALNAIAQPQQFAGDELSRAFRDALFSTLLTDPEPVSAADPLRDAAVRLRAQLEITPAEGLAPEEAALLGVWLQKV